MKQALTQILRSRWLVAGLHAGCWLLLYLAAINLGGTTPGFREGESFPPPPQNLPPVAKLGNLFAPGVWPKSLVDTNGLNPFFTRHFIPQPTPAPPAPTTRKIELTYQGFYQTADGPKQTMVRFGDSFLVAIPGAKVTANLFVADVNVQALTLTNLARQTNILPLNAKREIEVPIQ